MKGFLHIITDGKVVYFSSMDIDQLRAICTALPAVTEDIKWGHDLVFSVGGKMFCVASLEPPFTCSFKVRDEEFEELSGQDGFEPAPYMARAKWVLVTKPGKMNKKEWERRVRDSYDMVKQKLTKKARTDLGIL
jgi:predicted DNA-binding protein (MmcQ/YjbR family)